MITFREEGQTLKISVSFNLLKIVIIIFITWCARGSRKNTRLVFSASVA